MVNNISFWKSDMKRALTAKGFLIGIVLLLLIFLNVFRTYIRIDGSMSTYEIIIDSMALSGFSPFAAIFPALGYSSQYCQELHSGYFRMILSRMSVKTYTVIRLISVGISGGLIMGIPTLILVIAAHVFGYHEIPDNGLLDGLVMGSYIQQYGEWSVLCFKVLLVFLFGVMFSIISFAFAVWSKNRYVAIICPFILYESLWAILPLKLMILNPIHMFRGDDLNSYGLSAVMELLYIVIAVVVVWIGLNRRKVKE